MILRRKLDERVYQQQFELILQRIEDGCMELQCELILRREYGRIDGNSSRFYDGKMEGVAVDGKMDGVATSMRTDSMTEGWTDRQLQIEPTRLDGCTERFEPILQRIKDGRRNVIKCCDQRRYK